MVTGDDQSRNSKTEFLASCFMQFRRCSRNALVETETDDRSVE